MKTDDEIIKSKEEVAPHVEEQLKEQKRQEQQQPEQPEGTNVLLSDNEIDLIINALMKDEDVKLADRVMVGNQKLEILKAFLEERRKE